MIKLNYAVACIAGGILLLSISGAAAEKFHIPASDLKTALDNYAAQTGVELVVSSEAVRGVMTKGASGDLSDEDALKRILAGTGFVARHEAHAVVVVHDERAMEDLSAAPKIAAAPVTSVSGAALETVTVTSSKIGGDVQNIPISITALSQEQLTATQTAGGPDLIKQVPNMTFTKTNFSGYSIQLRGIGTQAISVTTDPAVAVAFNDIPFIRNHFFEQEFYDVSQVEVLRGPQGTLYGRNATAGVVNLISAKPSDQFEAMASADIGNYQNRRLEAMINIPVLDDRFDIRIAGEWTKRNGYTFNASTDKSVDGRDLWSGRVTLAYKPTENLQTTLVWEHFSEDDDRMRTAKQLCKTVQPPTEIKGQAGSYSFDEQVPPPAAGHNGGGALYLNTGYLSQSCQMTSLYSPDAFEVPYGLSLPYVVALGADGIENAGFDPYSSTTQSRNLRVIDTALNPIYKAKNDTLELNTDYTVTPSLTFTSQTGYNQDFLYSTEDYDRFDTAPGIFSGRTISSGLAGPPNSLMQQLYHLDPSGLHVLTCTINNDAGCPTGTQLGTPCTAGSPTPNDTACSAAYQFCDPQLGCSDRLVVQDLSDENAWQLSQEFRLASNFTGPLNFSIGGNYLHYETEENYYVFANALTAYAFGIGTRTAQPPSNANLCVLYNGAYQYPNPIAGGGNAEGICGYVDQNPLGSIDNKGHNYFLSQNPYTLNSYAGFGEASYNVASDLKLTGGLRWTEDQKHFTDIPSELLTNGYGYYTTAVVNQQWNELTGRAVANWTPKLDFTDQTLIYGSYARGYKAGGANPPGAIFETIGGNNVEPDHPLTFKPEFINAFELGSKNTLLDGALTLNGDVFYYDYKDYQISEIVDRSSINLNFSSTVKGAELESSYEPIPGLRFNFAGGWEDTRIDNGQSAIDLMDRTAGMPGWMVVKPWVTDASNCILPNYVVAALLYEYTHDADGSSNEAGVGPFGCTVAYTKHLDPVTVLPYGAPNPAPGISNPYYYLGYPGYNGNGYSAFIPSGYPGFNPDTPAYNNGEGFAKNLGGNKLPNAPPFTVSFGAQYTLPITTDWAGTLRGDYYWQDYSWARVENDNPYDRLRGYTNVNLTLIFTNQDGWQVMFYDKNVFNTTAITGDFLNSDDSGLTTNVFLTDPKLIGIRVTKNW